MSKGIIVFDNIPECCVMPDGRVKCPLAHNTIFCSRFSPKGIDITNGEWDEIYDQGIRPDWCPIRPMPERRDEQHTHYDSDFYRAEGWNSCIDELETENMNTEKENDVKIKPSGEKWYRWEDNIKPQDKQLCLVIPKGENYVGIYQYRAPEKRWPQFLDVSHAFVYSNMDTDFRLKHYLDYISPSYVDRWKFLNLPEDVNERILEEIEKWFDN